VPHINAVSPAAAWYLYFDFVLVDRKTEIQKKIKYRCERPLLSYGVNPAKGEGQKYASFDIDLLPRT
jgi:hypothetical protein